MFYNNVILKDSLLNDFIKDKPFFLNMTISTGFVWIYE
jgi:hypothetical protein